MTVMRWGTVMRLGAITLVLMLLTAACGDDDAAETTATTETVATTAPPEPTTTAPATTTEASTTTETAFEPAPSITLDDPALAEEPSDTSYRAQLTFGMRAELDDGSTQEGIVKGDGGKLLNPAESHAMVVDVEGLVDLPDCFDIAGSSPNYVSAYHTFYGGLSGEAGGDLMGEALLSEPGIMTNGVLVDRYEITLANVDPEDANEYTSFTDAYIDIARDGGHLVRLAMNGTGTNNSFTVDQSEPREITYRLDFSEFGEITEFTTPEGCQT
jgi:hypothetical protein